MYDQFKARYYFNLHEAYCQISQWKMSSNHASFNPMKMNRFLIMVFVTLVCFACAPSKKDVQKVSKGALESYEAVAQEKFGVVNCELSPQNTYALCLKSEEGTPRNPGRKTEFLVLHLASDSIVYQQILEKGAVKWFSDEELEILRIPGIMAEGQTLDDYTITYNVKDGTRIAKKAVKENE